MPGDKKVAEGTRLGSNILCGGQTFAAIRPFLFCLSWCGVGKESAFDHDDFTGLLYGNSFIAMAA